MMSENPAIGSERCMLTLKCIICGSLRWPRQDVEMRRSAECGRCADQKPSASSPFQTWAIHVWHTYSFFSFLSLSRLDGPRRRPTISSHHDDIRAMRIPSRTRRLRNISSVCALVCMCQRGAHVGWRETGGRLEQISLSRRAVIQPEDMFIEPTTAAAVGRTAGGCVIHRVSFQEREREKFC